MFNLSRNCKAVEKYVKNTEAVIIRQYWIVCLSVKVLTLLYLTCMPYDEGLHLVFLSRVFIIIIKTDSL